MIRPKYAPVLQHLMNEGEALSASEIAADLKMAPETVRRIVLSEAKVGRIEPLGMSANNARCYGITRLGHDHLLFLDS